MQILFYYRHTYAGVITGSWIRKLGVSESSSSLQSPSNVWVGDDDAKFSY